MNDNPLALVIEDDPDAAAIFSTALEVAGFEVETISSGAKAIERLQVVTPKMIVLDLHLPYVAGTDILAHIRADPRLEEVPIIIVTADASMADLTDEHADLVLLKPITFSQIRDLAIRLKSQGEDTETAE